MKLEEIGEGIESVSVNKYPGASLRRSVSETRFCKSEATEQKHSKRESNRSNIFRLDEQQDAIRSGPHCSESPQLHPEGFGGGRLFAPRCPSHVFGLKDDII